ncbi:bifunctional glycosyltransferase/CDP-glycerol:glycerophosphate glycerophosphotransferase [Nocardiopsis suaedae]|uniref:CDP-glycerol:glycerophosphate glycerophosphotransferase n=1 Tax=Nocardiopsis suaedae TaxID=3018444 RepID=A0ABT4TP40_9ACTN|nr:CDP-glycerol:glycerophosphate glycerophosphotransferase [Nocardiopsis suaedae]MDA2806044.1 CDP-glycerol:glycerophosphate glycerophosphotransferase [Nocardiopsis suaedae]
MPVLSVIVPVYNVERYLGACLDSLRGQTLGDLEIVVVDDGSPDDSARIAAEHAERDPRVRIVRQDNAGLGAARNTGVRHADGDFLAFVDSDDAIPPYAFGAMVAGLQESGSDFATGNVHRYNELGSSQSPMHRRIFRHAAVGTHVTRRENLLTDRLATNKVWRRDFWDRHGLAFPEGVLYEDISVAIPAHFLASGVDVHTAPVYLWRERPGDDPSITQDRLHPKGLRDRYRAVRATADFLAGHGRPEDRLRWDAIALGSDLRIFLQLLGDADDAFRALFCDLAGEYMRRGHPRTLTRLPAFERLKWHLVRRRDIDRLLHVLAFERDGGRRRVRAVRHGLRFYGDYPFKDDRRARVPRRIYRLDDELVLRQKAERVAWEDGRLVVEGRVCLKHLRPNRRYQQFVRAHAVDAATGRRTRLPVESLRAAEYTAGPDDAGARHDWGGYRVTVDPRALAAGRSPGTGEWWIELTVLNRGITRTAALAHPVAGAPCRPETAEVGPGLTARPVWVGGLRLLVSDGSAAVTGHTLHDGDLVLEGVLADPPPGAALRLRRLPGDRTLEVPLDVGADGRFRCPVPVDTLADGFEERRRASGGPAVGERWEIRAVGSAGDTGTAGSDVSGGPRALTLAGGEAHPHLYGDHCLAVEEDRRGSALIHVSVPRPRLEAAHWDGRVLVLQGTLPGGRDSADDRSLVIKAKGRHEEVAFPMAMDGEAFEARIPVDAVPRMAGTLPLASGSYRLFMKAGGDGAHDGPAARLIPVQTTPGLLAGLPAAHDAPECPAVLDAADRTDPVLTVGPALLPEERGSRAQKRLREEVYPGLRGLRVRSQVYFESYSGKQYSDSPRVISEELRRRGAAAPSLWLVRDRQVRTPQELRPVPHASREYFEALATSEVIVTNAHLPRWFDKREGQRVVQTWHGSMLKRIGFDIENVRFASHDASYHERLAREVRQWDYLVSPSPWATPILRRAFRFEGTVLETGYPRNDIFHSPEREETARAVRRRLGLPEGKKVVLYAPTWRDDKFYSPGKYKLDLRLDMERMREALGGEHVLLVRRHPNIVDRVPGAGDGFVRDVSAYPEVQELFLVADVLVTDYSSLMFDFANTGRPMLFYTYDLEEYRDRLRGFYFDFEEVAPGPLIKDQEGLVEAVRAADAVRLDHRDRYEAFVERFCPLDDGKAAARVVDAVFGPGGGGGTVSAPAPRRAADAPEGADTGDR